MEHRSDEAPLTLSYRVFDAQVHLLTYSRHVRAAGEPGGGAARSCAGVRARVTRGFWQGARVPCAAGAHRVGRRARSNHALLRAAGPGQPSAHLRQSRRCKCCLAACDAADLRLFACGCIMAGASVANAVQRRCFSRSVAVCMGRRVSWLCACRHGSCLVADASADPGCLPGAFAHHVRVHAGMSVSTPHLRAPAFQQSGLSTLFICRKDYMQEGALQLQSLHAASQPLLGAFFGWLCGVLVKKDGTVQYQRLPFSVNSPQPGEFDGHCLG